VAQRVELGRVHVILQALHGGAAARGHAVAEPLQVVLARRRHALVERDVLKGDLRTRGDHRTAALRNGARVARRHAAQALKCGLCALAVRLDVLVARSQQPGVQTAVLEAPHLREGGGLLDG